MANNKTGKDAAGTTFTYATDDVAGVDYPVVKLSVGTEDAATRVSAGGGTEADALRVTVATDSTGVISVDDNGTTISIDDGAGSITVDGTITANLAAGTNAIGKLAANSGVDIGDVDITSLIPGNGASNLGKSEDAAHSSGDVGVMVLGVRNDAGTVLAGTTSDYIPLSMDANGYLRVNVAAGAASGTEYTEGDVDTTVTGRALMWEDASDTLRVASATKPLPVAQTGTATVLVDDSDAVEVRGNTSILRPTITGSTSAYSIGDVVGGEVSLNSLTRTTGGGAILNTITLWSDDALTPKLDILFFDADLTGGTYTDNGALTLSTADKAAILGIVEIATTDWKTVAGDTWVTTTPLGLSLKGNGTSDLRMIIVTQTAMTMAATTGLTATLGLLRD